MILKVLSSWQYFYKSLKGSWEKWEDNGPYHKVWVQTQALPITAAIGYWVISWKLHEAQFPHGNLSIVTLWLAKSLRANECGHMVKRQPGCGRWSAGTEVKGLTYMSLSLSRHLWNRIIIISIPKGCCEDWVSLCLALSRCSTWTTKHWKPNAWKTAI